MAYFLAPRITTGQTGYRGTGGIGVYVYLERLFLGDGLGEWATCDADYRWIEIVEWSMDFAMASDFGGFDPCGAATRGDVFHDAKALYCRADARRDQGLNEFGSIGLRR